MKIILLITFLCSIITVSAQSILESAKYRIGLSDKGEILYYIDKNNINDTIHFRQDQYAGPSYEGVELSKKDNNAYLGNKDGISYELRYKDESGVLSVEAIVTNTTDRPFIPEKGLGLRLGLDTYMEKFPEWNKIYFPTMLRAEKTHFTSYFMTPEEGVFTVTSSDPIASWRYNYQQQLMKLNIDGVNAFHCLHRIYTVTFDLLHRLPLPQRHPQNLYMLAAGESKSFKFYLNSTKGLDKVNDYFHAHTEAPVLSARYYTIPVGDTFEGNILSDSLLRVEIRSPRDEVKTISLEKVGENKYKWSYSPISGAGLYTMTAISMNGKISEMALYVRPEFDFYLKYAREEALKFKPTDTHHAECFYPLFSYFLGRKYLPDAVADAEAEKVFQDIFKVLYDDSVGEMRDGKFRIQDAATMISVLVDRYAVTKDISNLEKASKLADFLLKQEGENGGYYTGHLKGAGKKTHYTSVIYIAKSVIELATTEKTLISDPKWKARYERHKKSGLRAIDDLANKGDNVETEGQMTFEDGMISCSASQLAYGALRTDDAKLSDKFLKQAIALDKKHQCLTQKLMPDARMNGATLRFWEYQYTINMMHGGMNSPCGWSAWKIYGTWYLYLLTGEYKYMQQTINSLSSCLQLMDIDTKEFHFGFITDPFIECIQYKETPEGSGQAALQRIIVGEQYLSKMSDWHVKPNKTWRVKWGIDNFNHEIIKCMTEIFIPNAFVLEREDGVLETVNCTAERKDGKLVIDYSSPLIEQVHINLQKHTTVEVVPQNKTYKNQKGLVWLGGIPEELKTL